jgi:hypothetical protein
VVYDPLEGAKRDGIGGFITGVGTGVIGIYIILIN